MPHKYRAAIGRRRRGPASRGTTMHPKPRRRNCLWQFRLPRAHRLEKRLLREKSRFCGGPQNAGRPFGRQGISSSVNAAGIPVGCRVSGKKVWSMAWQPNRPQTCGAVWPQNRFVHPMHGCARPPPFGQSPKRGQKCFLCYLRRPRRINPPAIRRVRQAAV